VTSSLKSSKRWLIPTILAAGVLGFVLLNVLKPRPVVQPTTRPAPVVQTETITAAPGGIRIRGSGAVKPRHELIIAAEVSGRVSEVHPRLLAGGQFSQGDRLITLDPAPFNAALAQAQADLASAQASLRLAEQLYTRTQDLISKGFLSQQTLDERTSQRDQAAAALARAQALVDTRTIDLRRSEITAPYSGIVLSQRVSPGEIVQPGRELARVFPSDRLEVTVSLTDRDFALLGDVWRDGVSAAQVVQRPPKPQGTKPGQPGQQPLAEVIVTHGSQVLRWPARVDRVEAAVDPTTRTFNVVVTVENPWLSLAQQEANTPPLLVGMFAQVEIEGLRPEPFARIPRKAIREGQEIWVLDDQRTLRIYPIRLLYESDQAAYIALEGLPPRFDLITSDLKVPIQGMTLRTQEPAAKGPSS
jgi:RND family efflux transporter MFP subunit